MLEKDYYSKLTKHYESHAVEIQRSIVWEAKRTRTHRLPFNSLEVHQETNLLDAETSHGYKISDSGPAPKPYDGYAVYGALSVVVVIYYLPRATEIYEIPIRTFIQEKYTSKDKSLTKARASQIGKRIVI
jgi:hypothetical protein